jgi:HPt (histidine-containing phosphotransfer) domain-containing protein
MKKQNFESAIQVEALNKLRLLDLPGEPDLLPELATLFFETAPGRIQRMREHFNKGNLEALSKEAHLLKSSAGSLGAHRLVRLCQEIETTAWTAGSDLEDPLLEKIERLYDEYSIAASRLVDVMKTSEQ